MRLYKTTINKQNTGIGRQYKSVLLLFICLFVLFCLFVYFCYLFVLGCFLNRVLTLIIIITTSILMNSVPLFYLRCVSLRLLRLSFYR